ncbi:4Fe-4S dicluster domain-containing protein [Slackia heliotrinireducens]|uniref:4Fe-4S dicluster domain-containing protein n=1 Tax=Slackia heliotrinireducens TaxID=84110 RepID=UPI0033156F9E
MILSKQNLAPLLQSMAGRREVFVPAEVNGVTKFAQYDENVDPRFDLINTTMPPKDLLFPQTQRMYGFRVNDEGNYEILEYDESRKRAVVGIRPCDMRSIVCLDQVFLTKGFVDEFYANAREKLLTVCIGCTQASETCFCESMGTDPQAAPNADIMLQDCGETYNVVAQTEKGEAEVALWGDLIEDGRAEPTACDVTLRVSMDGVVDALENMYNHPIWDDLSVKCLNCGTCTYVCPTCHCFDISQDLKMKEGVRFRCWDSCMFSEYTAMAGGHNPRPTKKERVRNRFMHKLNFFERRYGMSLCVGCGRCVEKCPVALDITRLIDDIGSLAAAEFAEIGGANA